MTIHDAAARTWDVAVVGAGPAGALAARQLAALGVQVVLIDKSAFPRNKVCGGCLNRRALEALEDAGLGNVVADLGASVIDKLRVSAGGRPLDLALPAYQGVTRSALDQALLCSAESAGAVTVMQTRATDTRVEGDVRLIDVQQDDLSATLRAKVVIAADGLGSTLAKRSEELDVRIAKGSRIGAGVIADDAPSFFSEHVIHMACGEGGYVGAARVENGLVDIAAAFDSDFVRAKGGLGPAAESILDQAGFPVWSGFADLPWRGTPPLTRRSGRVAGTRLFTVGDAAGYIEPFTGEGLACAMTTGMAVVDFAERAVVQYDMKFEQAWIARHKQLVTRRQYLCRTLAVILRHPKLVRSTIAALRWMPALASPMVRQVNARARLRRIE